MKNGTTVIMNDEYISELTRHRDMYLKQVENEVLPDAYEKVLQKYKYFEAKLNEAIEFSDTVEEIVNLDIPRLTAVKTISGLVLPIKHVQIIE
jgi:hypothetical protein